MGLVFMIELGSMRVLSAECQDFLPDFSSRTRHKTVRQRSGLKGLPRLEAGQSRVGDLAVINGIKSRSSAPTFSMGWVRLLARCSRR